MAGPLLYPSSIAIGTLTLLIRGLAAAPADVFTFPPGGGDNDLELAVPRLPGMDEVVVDVAQLRVVARTTPLEPDGYQVVDAAGGGSILDLGAESRLRKVVVDAPATGTAALPHLHTVVRAAPGRVPGPPLFADPAFDGPPMFGRVLEGLTVSTVAEGRQLSLPGAPGSAWLLQYATGQEVTELTPLPDRLTVRRVVVDAAATDVTLVIRGATDDEQVPLWHHPGAFLPEAGEQEISFTALAQKQLAAALADDDGTPALPIPLRVSATGAGAVQVTRKTLTTRYLARPLGPEPVTARIGGDWTPLTLSAPAARRPQSSTLRVTARHWGRELNGTRFPPLVPPRAGFWVGDRRLVAAAVPVDGTVSLVVVRALVSAVEGAEAVLELRADAAGAPGTPVAAPVVLQVPPATDPAWLEFVLPAPVAATAGSTVWAALRTNRGALRWCALPGGSGDPVRASLDSGASWGEVDGSLVGTGGPVVQLFHLAEPAAALPVELYLAGGGAGTVTLTAVPGAAREFQAVAELPAAVLATLAAATGGDRADTPLTLFSRAVADLTVTELTLAYDPFAPAGG